MQRNYQRQFLRQLQAGEVTLMQVYSDVIAVFGESKVGKTTSCHSLAGSIMKSVRNETTGDLTWKVATSQFANAEIGYSSHSKTQIPNLFPVNINNQTNILVIDQPGYQDTNGFFRIFANGYYHYLTFSKAENLRFVLTFQHSNLKNKGGIWASIREFTSSFRRYDVIKNTILSATCFLITKVQQNITIATIQNSLKELIRQMPKGKNQQQWNTAVQIVTYMLQNAKIFLMKKPAQQGITIEGNRELLEAIIKRNVSWQRELHDKYYVDMDQINFSVANVIRDKMNVSNGVIFKNEAVSFIKTISNRLGKFLTKGEGSLIMVLKAFFNDNVSQFDTSQCVKRMEKLVNEEFNFIQIKLYQDARQNYIKSVFSKSAIFKQAYCIMKREVIMKIFDCIIKLKQSTYTTYFQKKSITWLQSCYFTLEQIFIGMHTICKNKGKQLVQKYCYLMKRIFDEAKMSTILLFNKDERQYEFNYEQFAVNLPDFFMFLNDQFIEIIHEKLQAKSEIDKKYLLSLEHLPTITSQVLLYAKNLKGKDVALTMLCARMHQTFVASLLKKEKSAKILEERLIALGQLNSARKDLLLLCKKQDQSLKVKQIELAIVRLTNQMAQAFLMMDLFEIAIEFFSSIWNTDQVIRCYEKQIDIFGKNQNKKAEQKEALITLGDYAATIMRKELAQSCYHKALFKDPTLKESISILNKINNVINLNTLELTEVYKSCMKDTKFYRPISQEVEQKVSSILREK